MISHGHVRNKIIGLWHGLQSAFSEGIALLLMQTCSSPDHERPLFVIDELIQ
jgi:hypothetical protein